jgi:hypothetical protein
MPGSLQDSDVRAPSLRALESPERDESFAERRRIGSREERPALRLVDTGSSLLIAGADPGRRAALLAELAQTMPEGTCFEQATTLPEVLEHAPSSRMVILSGGLEDASARSLMRVLGQRHPRLPVISVGAVCQQDL